MRKNRNQVFRTNVFIKCLLKLWICLKIKVNSIFVMGASMTSFAAGWQKDDAGVWHYYDSDDEMVTGEWKKMVVSGSTLMMTAIC